MGAGGFSALCALVAPAGGSTGLALLSGPDRATGMFAGSGLQALAVLRAARELGLRVPEVLSVVGYQYSPLTEWIRPTLTTVTRPL